MKYESRIVGFVAMEMSKCGTSLWNPVDCAKIPFDKSSKAKSKTHFFRKKMEADGYMGAVFTSYIYRGRKIGKLSQTNLGAMCHSSALELRPRLYQIGGLKVYSR